MNWFAKDCSIAVLALFLLVPAFAAGSDGRASVRIGSSGFQANGFSQLPAISEDGRFVAFESFASNLVAHDTNRSVDIFVRDRLVGRTTRVSVSDRGTQGNARSHGASISDDGRFVAFSSSATNLVSGDSNGVDDVFVHDRTTRRTTRVSLSGDGMEGNQRSDMAQISADGRVVAFDSHASNLVAGDRNEDVDVYVRELQSGVTSRVSVSSTGGEGAGWAPALSSDGRLIAFRSAASLVPEDSNGFDDVYLHDRETHVTTRVSVSSDGAQANSRSDAGVPAISGNGSFVIFGSFAWNLVPGDVNQTSDAFVHNVQTKETSFASATMQGAQADGSSYTHSDSISRDGRYLAFTSGATNLAAGDTNGILDVFVYDQLSGERTRVSVATGGGQANAVSAGPALNGDGHFVAFTSIASNLVPRDTNKRDDVFVHDRLTGETTRVSVANLDAQCRVPRLIGLTLRKARARIVGANCSSGHIRSVRSSWRRGRVLRQKPKAGKLIVGRGDVDLVISRGRPPSR